MKLKSIVCAALLAASGAGAFAANYSSSFDAQGNADISFTNVSGTFSDTWTFTGLTSGQQYTIEGGLTGNKLSFSSVTLNSLAWTLIPDNKGKYRFAALETNSIAPLVVTIAGTAQSGGHYIGALSVTAVPEPETYAMLLAGLGLMGGIARRRSQKSNA